MTNRMIPTSMVSRIDRAFSQLSPPRTPNQAPGQQTQKSKPGAASRAAANKDIRNANGNELLDSSSSLV